MFAICVLSTIVASHIWNAPPFDIRELCCGAAFRAGCVSGEAGAVVTAGFALALSTPSLRKCVHAPYRGGDGD